jgi:enoyl-CoA hydratase
MADYQYLEQDRSGGVLRITVNRPDALNALSSRLLADLTDAFSAADGDEDVRVVILTGVGDRVFIAGGDIREMMEMSPIEARDYSLLGHRLAQTIEGIGKPVIAAVNGAATGGGCELATACDIRIASERARFSQPEVKLGVPPGWGGALRLVRIVGAGRAREMILTGRMVPAEEALRIGLIHAVVPQEGLMAEAESMAATIAANGPVALAHAKRFLNQVPALDSTSATELEADLFALCFATEDQREGMSAFLEKRAAQYRGR